MISATFLDAEARAATAAGSRVGVGHLEGCTSKILDIIHHAPIDEVKADRVDDKRNAVRDSLGITFFGLAKRKSIGKAGTTAAVDSKPQYGGLALLFGNKCHAPCGAG